MLFLLVIVAVIPLMIRMGVGRKPDPVELAALNVGPRRVIRITVEPNIQQTLSLHYHVIVDGRTVVEHAFFGTLPRTSPPPTFLTYTDEEGDLVGVAQASVPKRIIILHDFTTGESWPMRKVTYKPTDTEKRYPYYEEAEPILARGRALFERLQQAHSDEGLELLETMGMRPLTIPVYTETSD